MSIRNTSMLIGVCAMVGACTSAPKSIAFPSDARDAMLVLAAPPDGAFQRHVLRRVDLEKGRFVGEPIIVEIDNFRGLDSLFGGSLQNQLNADEAARPAALVVKQLPPGDYARVEISKSVNTGVQYDIEWVCTHNLAPIYEVAAGKISIIRADEMSALSQRPAEQDILAEYQRARAAFPGLKADAGLVRPKAAARWSFMEVRESGARYCVEPDSFTSIQQ